MAEVYAAIEMAEGETPHGTVHRFMQAAVAYNQLFEKLDVLGVFTLGTRRFVRFRTDGVQIDLVTQDIRKNRGIVTPNGLGYKVRLPGGRQGSVPTVKMHTAPQPNYKRVYRGPEHELWEAQFSDIVPQN